MKKTICLIPARSGSVRVKDKNIRPLLGTCLLEHAIKRALSSNIFSSVVCCTDSEEYAQRAESYGAHIPGLRPREISGSTSPDYEWVMWAYENTKCFHGADYFAILRPTAPFLKQSSIISALNHLIRLEHYESLRVVSVCDQHPFKMWTLKGNTLQPLFPYGNSSGVDLHSCQKASLPEIYVQTAALDISHTTVLTRYKNISGSLITGFSVDYPESFDVNTEADWNSLNLLAQHYLRSSLA